MSICIFQTIENLTTEFQVTGYYIQLIYFQLLNISVLQQGKILELTTGKVIISGKLKITTGNDF